MAKKDGSLKTVLAFISVAILLGVSLFQIVSVSAVGTGVADSPWPMFGGNPQHTGLSPYNTSGNNGGLLWSYEVEITGTIISTPVIATDGTIYFGSMDKHFYALNPNGTLKWKYEVSGGIQATAAIDSNGTVYFGSDDNCVYALNPNGTLKWKYKTGEKVESSPNIGSDGTIYIGSNDNYLYALNPNGTLKWRYETDNWVESSPAISPDGNTIYVATIGVADTGGIYAINCNGTLKWYYPIHAAIYGSPSVSPDGIIYIGTVTVYANYVYALNPNGTLKWRYKTDAPVTSGPVIDGHNNLYFASTAGTIYAVDMEGNFLWKYETGVRIAFSPVISADGILYLPTTEVKLYALGLNGSLGWTYNTSYRIFSSSPTIGTDGTVYVASGNCMYAIGGNPATNGSNASEDSGSSNANITWLLSVAAIGFAAVVVAVIYMKKIRKRPDGRNDTDEENRTAFRESDYDERR